MSVRRTPAVDDLQLEVSGDQLLLRHNLGADDIDNDLAGRLASTMATSGVADNGLFEELFAAVVVSTMDDPAAAWSAFYRNTLDRLNGSDPGRGSIGEFAPIYRRARSLVRGSQVLDLASCFGFLPMLLADDERQVIASDVSVESMRLLAAIDGRLRCLCCAAEAVPLADRAVDTVLALHLLEHVEAAAASRVLAEAIRVARRRVVVAVPYEDQPDPAYGHVRVLDHAALEALGRESGLRHEVIDADGGWLVLDH